MPTRSTKHLGANTITIKEIAVGLPCPHCCGIATCHSLVASGPARYRGIDAVPKVCGDELPTVAEESGAHEPTKSLLSLILTGIAVSAGLTHIGAAQAHVGTPLLWKVEGSETLIDGTSALLGRPADLLLDRAGRLLIIDYAPPAILQLDPRSRVLDTLGRKGRGPGEYQ